MQNENPYPDWKKNISFFMASQAISLFGSSLVEFALVCHITLITKSGVMMTIGTLCIFIPRLLISIFSGVWADRYNRKLLIIFSDAGIALFTLMLAIAFLLGYQDFWLMFLILGIRSIGSGIQTPAIGAIIPQMVPTDNLIQINGLRGSLQSIIMLLAPAVSAGLLSVMPMENIFFIDVVTALIAIFILITIPVKPYKKEISIEKTSYYDDLRAGLIYSKRNIFVKEMLILYTFYFLFITPAAFLSQIAVVRSFGDEVWRLTANEIAFSGGMMLGGGIIAWWGGFKNGINTIAFSCFIIGLTSSLLAVPNFYLFLSMMFLIGISVSFFSSVEMTLFQKKVEQNMQGRIFGLIEIVATGVMPVGMLFFGPLGDIIKVEILFFICGILLIFLSIYIFFNKKLKQAVDMQVNESA